VSALEAAVGKGADKAQQARQKESGHDPKDTSPRDMNEAIDRVARRDPKGNYGAKKK
jgi:hypothetical protein